MKTLKFFSLLICMILCGLTANAQNAKEITEERQAIKKMAKKEFAAKVDKATKKEAKRLTKEGWVVSPGALPMEKQLQRSYEMEYQYDDLGFPKFIMANAQSIAENYDAAKTHTVFERATAICKMHKARVRANNYYWNKLYRKLELEGKREEFEQNKKQSNDMIC